MESPDASADVTSLGSFRDESVDIIIDKGCLDTVYCTLAGTRSADATVSVTSFSLQNLVPGLPVDPCHIFCRLCIAFYDLAESTFTSQALQGTIGGRM